MANVQYDQQIPITQISPHSPIAEAFRTIRTNVMFAGVASETNVILVTSTQPGEGKTSTASNLAVVCAQAGHRVLIMDADLRKPQVHYRFKVSNLDGMASALLGTRSLEECIQSTEIPNLSVLPSGAIPPNPSELLSSQAFRSLVDTCREQFDYIIMDSPPVLSVTDALILTSIADGTLFVVDSQRTNRVHAKRAMQSLTQVQARILGVVLNRVSRKSKDMYYSYNYYYSNASSVNA